MTIPATHCLSEYSQWRSACCGAPPGCMFKLTAVKFQPLKASGHCSECGGETAFYLDIATQKPPIGLIPQKIYREKRYVDVCSAIARYYNAGKPIPLEWIKEFNAYVSKQK